MRKRTMKSRVLGLLLSCVMVLTMAQIPSMTVHAEEGGVGGFVNRCYQVALGRAADPSGYADWTNQLTSGQSDGAYVAFGFVFSPEYTNSGKNNEAFVTDMYTLFLGRTPDEAGYRDWVGQLNAGADRQAIFAGFANSNEFYNICTSYGVTAGVHVPGYDRTQVNNVNMFVARMYRVCLNRLGDKDGQNDWVNRLLHGELSGTDCAHGFIYSKEYQNLGLSNEEYVENMYTAFMGRHSDPTGFNDWVSKLNAGYTRDEIFAGFANSNEFQNICNSYGIVRGSYTPTNVHSGNITPKPSDEQKDDPFVKEHGWRLKKETEPSGEYVVYNYTKGNDVDYTSVRYAANGSKIGPWANSSYDPKSNTFTYEQYVYNGTKVVRHDNYKAVYKNTGDVYYAEETMYDLLKNKVDSYYETQNRLLPNGEMLLIYEASYDSKHILVDNVNYTYDSKNRLLKCVERGEDNLINNVVDYTYDSNGTQTAITTYYNGDGKTVSYKVKTVTTYVNGRESTIKDYNKNGIIRQSTVYEYDSYGNKIKATTTGVDYKRIRKMEYEKY